jgi:hypothetical protein
MILAETIVVNPSTYAPVFWTIRSYQDLLRMCRILVYELGLVTIITPCKITDDTEARCLLTQFDELAYICGAMTTGAPPQDTTTAALGAGTKSPAPTACLLLSSRHGLQCVVSPSLYCG